MKYLTHIFFFIILFQFIVDKYDNNGKSLDKFLNIRNERFLVEYYDANIDQYNGNQSKKKKNIYTYESNGISQNTTNTKNQSASFYAQPTHGQYKYHRNNVYTPSEEFNFYNSTFMERLRHNSKIIMGSSAAIFFLVEDLGIRAVLFLIFSAAVLAYFTSI
ncbi:schizont membrane associated cytoadherence protein [Plasmodium berghei]|uniref:Schizont membrane associated cytoadherence protein n=2 Tax=Plasmodium berghei TaxID=5821 RepID=A0A509ACM0_PLABA|nr:schizont membrane associated cytoadherence protein [Plasmodium berghei ANKA]CXH79344.1 schizont membrane associated cytoadherence protein [Plasmodium berghei]SCM18947.1 schizont membrane associated cytoadherence protein [Plasmodium berghei]SCN21500.1 schizont membrane associated cytoadherence protein [Plasmodium berghei]SCO58753.1 schizont membrane associated cytoadherence protein [Plasmodium berghei]SCO58766.1 schizont membrane associated cytoadherence protein [Plasmodium berghei]|eukprot:XP_034419606.1 schizont membrane associated cytoadherence protein [Plasmodium berghei ANKA]